MILNGSSAYRLADNGDLRSKLVELTAELNAEKAEARIGRPPIRPQSGKLYKVIFHRLCFKNVQNLFKSTPYE